MKQFEVSRRVWRGREKLCLLVTREEWQIGNILALGPVWVFLLQKDFKRCNVKQSNTCKEAWSYQLLGKAEVGPQNCTGWNVAAWVPEWDSKQPECSVFRYWGQLKGCAGNISLYTQSITYTVPGCSWHPLLPFNSPPFRKLPLKRLLFLTSRWL